MDRFGTTDIVQNRKSQWQQPKTPHDLIRKQLAILATARQATLQEPAYLTYCRGLDGFLIQDLSAAIGQLCLQDAPMGKTSMPSLGLMVTACQSASRHRHEAEALSKQAQESQYVRDHPDRFCSWKELLTDMEMMREAVEVAFGPDWRQHPLMQERVGTGIDPTKHKYGLSDMYALAMRP